MTTRYTVRFTNASSANLVTCETLSEAKSFAAHMRREGYKTLILLLNVEAI